MRWGILMVPVFALEATANAFVGHRFGLYKARRISTQRIGMPSTWKDVRCESFRVSSHMEELTID